MAYHEQGRSEAQAEMLMSIIHALDGVKISSVDSREYLRNLILLRTAQILEAMTEHLPEQTVSGFLPDKTT